MKKMAIGAIVGSVIAVSAMTGLSNVDLSSLAIIDLPEIYRVDFNGGVKIQSERSKILINVLQSAGKNDVVIMDISTFGGHVVELLRLLDAIESTKAKVVANVVGYSMSAGVPLALAADEVNIGSNSIILVHMAQGSRFGIGYGMLPLDDPMQKHVIDILDKYVSKFMTKEEIVKMVGDEDIYISGAELRIRLDAGGAEGNDGMTVRKAADIKLGKVGISK